MFSLLLGDNLLSSSSRDFVVCIGTEAGVLIAMFGSCTSASLHLALRPSMVTDAALSTYAVFSSTLGGLAQPEGWSSWCFIELATVIASPAGAGAPPHSSTAAAAAPSLFLRRCYRFLVRNGALGQKS